MKKQAREENAYLIMGSTYRLLKKEGRAGLADEYKKEAMAGDYDNLVAVTERYKEQVGY